MRDIHLLMFQNHSKGKILTVLIIEFMIKMNTSLKNSITMITVKSVEVSVRIQRSKSTAYIKESSVI